jgi:transcriptional regulator with XRE-family HTH domain
MSIEEFGKIIKKRRKTLNINQADLSEISEIALHTISDVESGKGNPTFIVLNKLCETLGLDLKIEVKNI